MARILDFFDGFSSATEPLIQFITAGKLASYADDASYEADLNGDPLEEGALYWNTTDKVVRVYNGTDWEAIQTEVLTNFEALGTGDGVAVNFVASFSPISTEKLLVFSNGNLQPKSSYSLSTNTIQFNTAPEDEEEIEVFYFYDGPQSPFVQPSGTLRTPILTVSASDITNKNIDIGFEPLEPTKVQLVWLGIGLQKNGVDFQIIGQTADWTSLGLDTFIEEDDELSLWFYS